MRRIGRIGRIRPIRPIPGAGRRWRALLLASLLLTLVFPGHGISAPAAAPAPVAWELRNFTLPSWGRDQLLESGPALEALAAIGANSVTFGVTWYQASKSANLVFANEVTASDESLVWAMAKARSLGLKTILKPHVDSQDGTWRAEIAPSDPAAWFASYGAMLRHYADLGRDQAAFGLVIGAELISMSTNPAHEAAWRTLITSLRLRWPDGKLTYGANWGRDANEEFSRVPFWDALDYLGISAYFELAGFANPTVWDLIHGSPGAAGWQQWYDTKIAPFQARWQKPVVFTEIGYRSVDGTVIAPWNHWQQTGYDPGEQRDAYEALFEFWSTVPWFAGGLTWAWPLVTTTPPNDTGYEIIGKPAAETVAAWFKPVPAIERITPASIPVDSASASIAVTGTGFVAGVSRVLWNGAERPTTFLGTNRLDATLTALDLTSAMTASLSVVNPSPGGGSAIPTPVAIANPVPVVSTVSPVTATAGAGAITVTVTGSSFQPGAFVTWNGLPRTTTILSSTRVQATVLASDLSQPGIASIAVRNPAPGGGQSGPLSFVVNGTSLFPLPTTASLTPASATAGSSGLTVTITGSGFRAGTTVLVNSWARATRLVSSTRIVADLTPPDLAAPGTLSLVVRNPGPGGGQATPLTLPVTSPTPTISALTPSTLTPGLASATFVLTGTAYVEGATVIWNGATRPTTRRSSTSLEVEVAAADLATPGVFEVRVRNPGSPGPLSSPRAVTIVSPNPVILALDPPISLVGSAPLTVTIAGSAFVPGSTIAVAGQTRPSIRLSDLQLQVALGSNDLSAPRYLTVAVTGPNGTSLPSLFAVLEPSPIISAIVPTIVPLGSIGTPLTVRGTGFLADSRVLLAGEPLPTTFISATELTAIVGTAQLTSGGFRPLQVENPGPGGGRSPEQQLGVSWPAPQLDRLLPSALPTGIGPVTLIVEGTGFAPGAVANWNGVARSTTVVSATRLSVALLAADLAQSSVSQVTVRNPDPTAGPSNAIPFTIGNGRSTWRIFVPASVVQ